MITDIPTRQLRCVLGPEINYKHTCDAHLHSFSSHMYDFFTHPIYGSIGICIKLGWQSTKSPLYNDVNWTQLSRKISSTCMIASLLKFQWWKGTNSELTCLSLHQVLLVEQYLCLVPVALGDHCLRLRLVHSLRPLDRLQVGCTNRWQLTEVTISLRWPIHWGDQFTDVTNSLRWPIHWGDQFTDQHSTIK